MTTELCYLCLTAILTACLWIPVVIGYVSARGPLKPQDYKVAPTTPLPAWVNRANRAHMNAVESFAPFAAVTLAARAANVSTSVTSISAIVFFGARVAHAVVHISGFSLFMARTLVFVVAWGAFMAFAAELLRHAVEEWPRGARCRPRRATPRLRTRCSCRRSGESSARRRRSRGRRGIRPLRPSPRLARFRRRNLTGRPFRSPAPACRRAAHRRGSRLHEPRGVSANARRVSENPFPPAAEGAFRVPRGSGTCLLLGTRAAVALARHKAARRTS